MKRFALTLGFMLLLVAPAFATNEFSKEWKDHYTGEGANEEFVKTARKAGCNVCHVKGEKKTERNEYGKAVGEFLKKEDFTRSGSLPIPRRPRN